MGLITDVVATVVGTLIAEDLKTGLPKITARMMQAAIRRLPPDLRERYEEEWHADLEDTPGGLPKLWVSAGFLIASDKMSVLHAASLTNSRPVRVLERAFAAYTIFTVYPLVLAIRFGGNPETSKRLNLGLQEMRKVLRGERHLPPLPSLISVLKFFRTKC